MLIYEPQGFSLTILSFTKTERGGEKDRQKERKRGRQTDNEMQNWGTLTVRTGMRSREGKLIWGE